MTDKSKDIIKALLTVSDDFLDDFALQIKKKYNLTDEEVENFKKEMKAPDEALRNQRRGSRLRKDKR